MNLWHYRFAIALLLGAAVGLIATAFVPSWDRTVRTTIVRLTPKPAPTPPKPVAAREPDYFERPTRCRRADAVTIPDEEVYEYDPRPELSIRTDSKIGRAPGIYVALIVGQDGRVLCADAVTGHQNYRAQAAALAMTWRFNPILRNGKPVIAQFYQTMPIRWLERRPQQRVAFPAIKDWNSLRLSLSRTSCFGPCPDYRVEIRSDGSVEYEGSRYVAVRGRHRAQIPKESVAHLFEQFRRVDFFWLHDSYAVLMTDGTRYTLELSFDGRTKRVIDYGGLSMGMPDVVRDLQLAVDDIADTHRWTKGNANTAPSLVAEGWNVRRRSKENLEMVAGITTYGTPEALRAVIALGAPITARTKAEEEFLIGGDITALEAAVTRGEPEILQILLKSTHWPRSDLNLALLSAAEYGRLSIVAPLIKAGADPLYAAPTVVSRERGPPAEYPAENGRSILMSAATSSVVETVEEILKYKPDVRARDEHGWTALHYAARSYGRTYRIDRPPQDSARVVELLIAAGADVNARTKDGRTPLALAQFDEAAAAALVKAGAK